MAPGRRNGEVALPRDNAGPAAADPNPQQPAPGVGIPVVPTKLVAVCTICQSTLADKGPSISSFSFGQLFRRGPRTAHEKHLLLKEFPGSNGGRRRYDTSKTLCTPCGHLFHSGCLREWFFVQRDSAWAPMATCPYCHTQMTLPNCRIIYPSTMDWNSFYKVDSESIAVGTSDGIEEQRMKSFWFKFSNSNFAYVLSAIPRPVILFAAVGIHRLIFGSRTSMNTNDQNSTMMESITQAEETTKEMEIVTGSFGIEGDTTAATTTDDLVNTSNYYVASAFGITIGCAALCIYAGRKRRQRKTKWFRKRSWILAPIIAIGLFLLALYFTFEDDFTELFFTEEGREVDEDEDLDKEVFEEKSCTWPLAISGSCFIAALADAFLFK